MKAMQERTFEDNEYKVIVTREELGGEMKYVEFIFNKEDNKLKPSHILKGRKQAELCCEELAIMMDALKDEQYREEKCGSRNIAEKLSALIETINNQVK